MNNIVIPIKKRTTQKMRIFPFDDLIISGWSCTCLNAVVNQYVYVKEDIKSIIIATMNIFIYLANYSYCLIQFSSCKYFFVT